MWPALRGAGFEAPIPAILIAVVTATLAVDVFDLAAPRERVGAWPAASRIAHAIVAAHRPRRHRAGADRWACCGASVVRGYECPLARVRDADAYVG